MISRRHFLTGLLASAATASSLTLENTDGVSLRSMAHPRAVGDQYSKDLAHSLTHMSRDISPNLCDMDDIAQTFGDISPNSLESMIYDPFWVEVA
jgi:hypothetical protein